VDTHYHSPLLIPSQPNHPNQPPTDSTWEEFAQQLEAGAAQLEASGAAAVSKGVAAVRESLR